MTPLRKKRLLLLSQSPNCNHKRWYSQYCELMRDDLVTWVIGMAVITDRGQRLLTSYMMYDLARLDRDNV